MAAIEATPALEDEGVPIEDIGESMKKQRSQDDSSVHIYGLQKQFGEKTAVQGLSLSMYSGQISCLLGHNGAVSVLLHNPFSHIQFQVLTDSVSIG